MEPSPLDQLAVGECHRAAADLRGALLDEDVERPVGPDREIDAPPIVPGITYSMVSCFSPGAIGARTKHRIAVPGHRIRREVALTDLQAGRCPPAARRAQLGREESRATRATVPSFRSTRRSSTARDPSSLGRGTTMCRAATTTGAVLEVSYTSTRIAVSGRSGFVWTGLEKYSMPPYRALSR